MSVDYEWENELFVLRGNDLKALCVKVQQVLAYLEANNNVCLKDLAFTLNTAQAIATSILTLVAENATDLQTKLKKALTRLQDPKCHKIHDVTGIYYFEDGLYRKGSLAFLFPGEGAQYLNMLADLRTHFPLITDFFSQFEKMGEEKDQEKGKSHHFAKKLRQVLFLPPNASEEEKEQAKAELKNLGTTMLSVMLADWALYFLLTKLGLQADATCGHSLGELVALGSAGCIETDQSTFFERVDSTFVGLQKQEVSGKVQEARLLAVGTGKEAVLEIIGTLTQETKDALFVAMDNCPHQCVVVGTHKASAELEDKMQNAAILFEHLPFSRPYHTKLFEPLLDEIHTLFENATFSEGTTTVYSCSTARPFPKEPKEIKHLTISHWSRPVEFTKMIQNMYDDGIRLFVEVGPRGNLTSFVSDILHGKTKAALASNVQRRSGITQLHHLCAELIAHKTPMDLAEFYAHRAPKNLALAPALALALALAPFPTTTNREKVLSSYFNVMAKFLTVQGDCMQKFLAATRSKQNTQPSQKNELQERMPLIGDIVRYEPGKLLVMMRKMDLSEDLFAAHHTVGGRTLSKVDPNQYGLPVVPGTFILEMMAEAASLLCPKKCVISLKNVRFMRWLAYEDVTPNVIQISARFNKVENGEHFVTIEISDMGKNPNETEAPKLAFTGTVVLADSYPEAPKVQDFPLTDEKTCSISLDIMRHNLFHGPLFHGVLTTDRIGNEGIESRVRVLSRESLFRSKPDPHFHLDPVLADCSMHHFVSWHLEQPDQRGRILLPAEIASFDIFAPPQPVGTEILSRGKIIDSSSRHFTHEVEAIGPNGTLLFQLRGVKFWRFYVPFGDVNFHGPKDAYFLSKAWNQMPVPSSIPEAQHVSCMHLEPPGDLKQPGMRLVTSRITLSPDEITEFQSMKAPALRLDEWLFGRIAAKDAIRTSWWHLTGERLFPADIEITPDLNGKPKGTLRDEKRKKETLPEVSISHTEGIVMALAAFSPHVGIDIEKITPREDSFEKIAFDADERSLIDSQGHDRNETIARFWCAKEALAKALGRGLIEGTKTVKIHAVKTHKIDPTQKTLTLSLGEKLSREFPHFQNVSLLVHTHRDKELIVATTFCERQTP